MKNFSHTQNKGSLNSKEGVIPQSKHQSQFTRKPSSKRVQKKLKEQRANN
tara:strand:- start:329 stop:478 length:150 start_codon:yes stop_codon:yes gene_type:complete